MKVFLCWSGDVSRQVATALREWLKNVVQNLEPWMSEQDIDKGTRWGIEIGERLSEYRVGIICLTADNLSAPWVHFEAGALSKIISDTTRVCPYLVGIEATDIKYPLALFQLTLANKADTRRMVHTINKAQEKPLDVATLDKSFERWWPDLDSELQRILSAPRVATTVKRSERDLLDELLLLARDISRNQPQRDTYMEELGNIEEHLDLIDGTIDLATKPSTVVGNKSGMIDRMKIELAFYEQTLNDLWVHPNHQRYRELRDLTDKYKEIVRKFHEFDSTNLSG